MTSSGISCFKQTVIPSKGVFKKVTELQDSSKEPESGKDVSIHDFKGVSIEFDNGMTLTQLPGSNTVTLIKGGNEEEIEGASLNTDGKEVIITNNEYKETIFKNGSIQFRKSERYSDYIIDKNPNKRTAKCYDSNALLFGSKIEVHRNTNESEKDIYELPGIAVKPFVSLTELNKIYWPRK